LNQRPRLLVAGLITCNRNGLARGSSATVQLIQAVRAIEDMARDIVPEQQAIFAFSPYLTAVKSPLLRERNSLNLSATARLDARKMGRDKSPGP
jgi:hypothetical protein